MLIEADSAFVAASVGEPTNHGSLTLAAILAKPEHAPEYRNQRK